MREFYESLDENLLKGLLDEGAPETARLEFKQFGWFNAAESRDRQKYKLIAKPLCAMANTHGGVIVYGIKTRSKNADGVDRADSLKPSAAAEKFVSVVSDLAASVIEPPLLGVEAELIPLASDDLAAKVWVPESRTKPHLVGCSEGEAHGHWQRSATGSCRMPQVSIEAAYRVRLYRELNTAPLVTPTAPGSQGDLICNQQQVFARVSNKGNAPAIRVSVSLESGEAGSERHVQCRALSALARGEEGPTRIHLDDASQKDYEEFFKAPGPHNLVIRFGDLSGASYVVRSGLSRRSPANPDNEMSYNGEISVERNGRRLA